MAYSTRDRPGDCSDELIEFICTLCNEKGGYTKAIIYCVDCLCFYCKTCTDAHNKDHGQHKHLLKEVDFPFINQRKDPNERCLVHRTQLLEMNCIDHDDIGCYMCINLEHGSCSNVRAISDIVENHWMTIDLLTTTELLKMATQRLNGIKTNKEKILKELLASRKHSIDTVKDFRIDLEKVLDQLEKASLKEIETEYDAKEISVRKQIEDVNGNVKRLEEALKGVNIADRPTSKKMFVSIKSAEKMLRSSGQFETTLSTEPQAVKDSFLVNTNISKYLRDLRSLGDMHTFEIEQTSFQVQKSTDIDV